MTIMINIYIYMYISILMCTHIYICIHISINYFVSQFFCFPGGRLAIMIFDFTPSDWNAHPVARNDVAWSGHMVTSATAISSIIFLWVYIYIYSDKTSKRGNRFVFDQCWFNYKLGGIVWPKLWIYPRLVVDISSTNDPKGPRWYPMAILSVPFLFGRPWYPKKPSKTHVESRNITI